MVNFRLYKVDAYRQDGPSAPEVLIERDAHIKALNDEMAIREADAVRARLRPTFIVIREGARIVHRSEPVFDDA